MFREYFVRRPYLRDTRENSRLSWLFAFQSGALHVATLPDSFPRASREIHLFLTLSLSLHTLSHTTLIIKKTSHKYREKWLNKITIKFGMELKPTQNSCKLQLYKNKINLRDKVKFDMHLKNFQEFFTYIKTNFAIFFMVHI